jgi:hypothetical protein
LGLARSEFDPQGPLELKRVGEKLVRTTLRIALLFSCSILSYSRAALHPFYVPAQERFVPAGELPVGELLVSSQGTLIPIESISQLNEITTVYNLRVADHHTYFVGGALWGWDVWVHNAYRLNGATATVTSDGVSVRMRSNKKGHAEILALQEHSKNGRLRDQNVVIHDVIGHLPKQETIPIGVCAECRTNMFSLLIRDRAKSVTIPVMKGQDEIDKFTINREFFQSAQSELQDVLRQYGRTNFNGRSKDAYAVLRKYHLLSKES